MGEQWENRQMDNRQRAIYLCRTRVGIGIVMMLAPRTGSRLGFGSGNDSQGAAVLGRAFGAREAALGTGAAIALSEREGGENWLSMSAVADAVDAAALLLTPRLPLRARLLGIIAAASAVAQFAVAKEISEEADQSV